MDYELWTQADTTGRFMSRLPLLITIDGPAASGKTTITRKLAEALRVPYLYTGSMYRAVTWLAGRRRVRYTDERGLARLASRLRIGFRTVRGGDVRVLVDGRDVTVALQDPAVARQTSASVASFPLVRKALVARQRRFFRGRGLVAEGRDMGSVVFPGAPYKFYLTASFEERVARRVTDLAEAGVRARRGDVERDLRRRDGEDAVRPGGALFAQPDAWIVDNSRLEQPQTIGVMLRRIRG